LVSKQHIRNYRTGIYLLDVLFIAISGFGGPQVHFTLFHKVLVNKRGYISESELKELNSLCSILPGPTSTQTIIAVGYKIGGRWLAFVTLVLWILPATLIMAAFGLLLFRYDLYNPKLGFLRFIQPMATAFIIYAAYKFQQLFVTKSYQWVLMIGTGVAGILLTTPYYIPVALLLGGLVSNYLNRTDYRDVKPIVNIQWKNFFVWIGLFLLAALLGAITRNKLFLIFENTYRFGSIVFGGGHVLIPMMFNQFVEYKEYLTPNEFLAGVGILQAIPGPVFSISTFTGSMSVKEWGVSGQLLGALSATAGIYLPCILFIFFVYPIWDQVKHFSPVKNAIEGINAASAGLVLSSAWLLFKPVEINEMNMTVLLATLFLLLTTKIPYPIIVLLCILAGFVIT
jgi:chromate transporter